MLCKDFYLAAMILRFCKEASLLTLSTSCWNPTWVIPEHLDSNFKERRVFCGLLWKIKAQCLQRWYLAHFLAQEGQIWDSLAPTIHKNKRFSCEKYLKKLRSTSFKVEISFNSLIIPRIPASPIFTQLPFKISTKSDDLLRQIKAYAS